MRHLCFPVRGQRLPVSAYAHNSADSSRSHLWSEIWHTVLEEGINWETGPESVRGGKGGAREDDSSWRVVFWVVFREQQHVAWLAFGENSWKGGFTGTGIPQDWSKIKQNHVVFSCVLSPETLIMPPPGASCERERSKIFPEKKKSYYFPSYKVKGRQKFWIFLNTAARCVKLLRQEALCTSSASCFSALSTACDGGHRLKVSGFVVRQQIKREKLKWSGHFSFH